MKAVRYTSRHEARWNEAVACAVNGTFLFDRRYMDYHADRFSDASLFFFSPKGRLRGLLPAHIRHAADGLVTAESHGGLTYGGLVIMPDATSVEVGEMLDAAAAYYAQHEGAMRLLYKAVPSIYFDHPALQDRYWLFRRGACHVACGLSTVVPSKRPLPFLQLRRRCVQKAKRVGLASEEVDTERDWKEAWELLAGVLATKHGVRPTHSLGEIRMLKARFPREIRLHVARGKSAEIEAMCVIYRTRNVAHAQYLATGDEGRLHGALDFLLSEVMESSFTEGTRYFDFGISTENGGQTLNEGLLFQKEGFGGRGICYDTYELDLTREKR